MIAYRLLIASLSLFVAMGVVFCTEPQNIRKAVFEEIKNCPKLEIQDLYKLTYQAAMGNEHMMSNVDRLRKFLDNELNAVDSSSSEPLIEYLTSDSSIARINLRPFKAQKGNPEKLIEIMIKTASAIMPSIVTLCSFWNDIELMAVDRLIPFNKQDLRKYFTTMEKQNFPAVHHSKIYNESYKPAYRIIAGKYAKGLLNR
jgi:hypothetical protein